MNVALCSACTSGWTGIQASTIIFRDRVKHEIWHRCAVCGSYWLETERYSVHVPTTDVPEEVKKVKYDE